MGVAVLVDHLQEEEVVGEVLPYLVVLEVGAVEVGQNLVEVEEVVVLHRALVEEVAVAGDPHLVQVGVAVEVAHRQEVVAEAEVEVLNQLVVLLC